MSHGTTTVGKTTPLLLAGVTTALLASSAAATKTPVTVRLPELAQHAGRGGTARLSSHPTRAVPLKLQGFEAVPLALHSPIEAIAASMFGIDGVRVVPSSSNGSVGRLSGVQPPTVAKVERCGASACSFVLQQMGHAQFSGQLKPSTDGSALLLMRQRLQ